MVDVILGLQWGDEGKGKIVDYFADEYDVVARFQGGPNAGHTLYVKDTKVVLHQIPSGIFHDKINLIGSGVVLDPITLKKECDLVKSFGDNLLDNLFISEKTHLILPCYRLLDKLIERSKGNEKIGSTLKGIGPAYIYKIGRDGLRVKDVFQPDFKEKYDKITAKLRPGTVIPDITKDGFIEFDKDETEFFKSVDFLKTLKIVNGEYFINNLIKAGKSILAEGAQGSMLDVDFGTYPFVTSSNTTIGAVCTGLGIAPGLINGVQGITKAYCTRVGSGPFPTELFDDTGEQIRTIGKEFGATTGRQRRCGWIDLVALKYACMINGVDELIMTKVDVLDSFEELKVCIAYEINGKQTTEIPFDISTANIIPIYKTFKGWGSSENLQYGLSDSLADYIDFIEAYLETPISFVSNGPGKEQVVPLLQNK